MRVLITGAAGFIGSHLADRWMGEGHEVYGIDDLTTGREDNFAGALWQTDVGDRDAFYSIANTVRPELVVHCAASYSNPDYWHRDTDTNVTGCINAAIVARHHGARLVYFQTGLPPVSSYAISKLAGEQYLRLSGVPLTVFRLANIYGPRNLSGPIPTFYRRLSAGERCTVMDAKRDMVYIDDLVDAVCDSVDAGRTGTFDICTGSETSIKIMYQAVRMAMGLERDDLKPVACADDVKPEVSVANRPPGWSASRPLVAGVHEAVAWYRWHGVEETYTHLAVKT